MKTIARIDTTSLAANKPAGLPLFQKVLTSVRQNIRLDYWSLDQKEFPLATTSVWSIKKYTLHGGKQEGVDVIEVDNGRLRLVVIPTRGMSVLKVESGDLRLGWDSPVREIVHPHFINLESRGGLGWLEGFNELIARCGLEWAGHPGPDRYRNHNGDDVEMNLTLHGRIGNIPASEVEVFIEAGPPLRIHLRGLVEERMFHGPQLSFWANVSTELDSNSVRINDTIINQGSFDQEFQLIYHTNFGPPLLQAGSSFSGPVAKLKSFNPHSAKTARAFRDYTGPQPGFIEEAYCLHPLAGPDGRTELLLQNARGDRGVSMKYLLAQLPCLTLWKNLGSESEGYVTGIEPGTGFPFPRRLERESGRVPKLAPAESRHFTIDIDIHAGSDSVRAAGLRIASLQGQTKTTIDSGSPP